MNIEMYKQKKLGPWHVIISPGNTNHWGGVLFTPIYDDIIVKNWLKLEDLSEDNLMTFYVTEVEHVSDTRENFSEYALDVLLEMYSEFENEQPEDSYLSIGTWDKKAEAYKELKEHCIEVLGEDYFVKGIS